VSTVNDMEPTTTIDPLIELVGSLAGAGKLALHNGRGGFACNSSSSHSIVVLPAGTAPNSESSSWHEAGQYGQAEFTLTDAPSKIRYLAALAADDQSTTAVLDGLRSKYGAISDDGDYVSTESTTYLPTDWHRDGTDPEFLQAFGDFLAHPDVAILGGSDSSSHSAETDNMIKLQRLLGEAWRARKDTADGHTWWVLFNVNDGTKMRLSFDMDDLRANAKTNERLEGYYGSSDVRVLHLGTHTPPTKAPAPELVDIKLTDACVYESDCGFCYMQSRKDGDPGDPVAVRNLLSSLAQLRVFEVAFGGGEPTLWPGFGDTLAFARSVGIVPNFTTKNYTWLNKPHAREWLDTIGAVAFSINDRKSMDRLVKNATSTKLTYAHNAKITVQTIPDLVGADDFKYIVNTATAHGWRVTLLGYKEVGRGATFTPSFRREGGWWFDVMTDIAASTPRLRGVAIDTALALQSKDRLDKAGIPDWMYHVEEGTFSAYVDAVTGRMGPSSYTDPTTFTPIDLYADVDALTSAFTAQFDTYTAEGAAS
jgi:hypothetical protein